MEKGTFKAVLPASVLDKEMWAVDTSDGEVCKVVCWAFDEDGIGHPMVINPHTGMIEDAYYYLNQELDDGMPDFYDSELKAEDAARKYR